jgi:hypothetical protein
MAIDSIEVRRAVFVVAGGIAIAVASDCGGNSSAPGPSASGDAGATVGSTGSSGGGSGGKGGGSSSGVGGSSGASGSGGAAGSGIDAAAGSGGEADSGALDGRADANADATADRGPDADPACAKIAVDAAVRSRLRFTADNECEVFVNGTSVGMTQDWGSPVTVDVSLFLYPGRKNVIAVRGTNTSSQGGNDRGVIGDMTVDRDGAPSSIVLTDHTWRASKVAEPSWMGAAFDDSGWIAATEIARHGDAPWGFVLGTSTAMWIWSAIVPVSTADKPNVETAYVRRSFYFTTDGTAIANSPGCP